MSILVSFVGLILVASVLIGVVALVVALIVRSNKSSKAVGVAPPAAAGWYPDPSGSGGVRYFDGVQWGSEVR